MSDEDDYMALLNRAKIACPETIENHERFEIPELEILQEGKITVFRNFIDVTGKALYAVALARVIQRRALAPTSMRTLVSKPSVSKLSRLSM